ncbi:MAG: sugar phosphate isomerase/epimerase, partial [Clostridiales bacterium]|nr:sugar phosphate isomerase/epimerase [Clostridiales bacterium]
MKLSFSIQNWYNYSWNEFCATAVDLRLQGVEIYNLNGPAFQGKSSPTNPELARSTRRKLINQNLSIPCIDTVCDFTDEASFAEMRECIELAVNLGVEYIGIHTACEDQEACIARINEYIESIGEEKVRLLIETTGAYADTIRLRDILNHFADDRLGALWNMHDTFVCAKEDAEKTITNLGAYVSHVHIHDFRMEDGKAVPELIGEGMLPIGEMMNALRSINYDGFISIRWNPEWMPELADIEIILTHFTSCMKRFEGTRRNRKHLYRNKTNTGKFIWKKEALIEKTFSQVLDAVVAEFPDQLAFKYTTLDYTRTYTE